MYKLTMVLLFLAMLGAVCNAANLRQKGVENLDYDQSLPKAHATHVLGQHRDRHSHKRSLADSVLQGTELTPLFPGYGTHFAYAYVGTPPQRQSLIIDTGSHYTAFPCTTCVKCGKHTDPYWDLKNSSTGIVLSCSPDGKKTDRCEISQSYAEGSSWKAFKVRDKLWVGGINPSLVPMANSYSVDFEFGCQTSAAGLFVTQLADGIMGMSNGPDTLPMQLKAKAVTQSSIFALCFRIGGGIMTLGGVDQRIHTKRTVSYAAMVDNGRFGWYSVNVRNVLLRPPVALHTPEHAISPNMTYLAGGAGSSAIVDSGTTDTYLPSSVAADFMATFKQVTGGLEFKLKNWKISKADLAKLPTIVFRVQAVGDAAAAATKTNVTAPGTTIDVLMPWTNYLDKVEEDVYNVRIGFTEERGAVVLGSNFMTGYNVIFDGTGARVGFAPSTCNYEEFAPADTSAGNTGPALIDTGATNSSSCKGDEMIPTTECTAVCNRNESAYVSTGTQQWKKVCAVASAALSSNPDATGPVSTDPKDVEERQCLESCSFHKVVRGNPECPDRPWTDCTHGCVKSRQTVPSTEKLKDKHGHCNYRLQTSTCYAGICPLQDGDYLVYIDLRVRIEPWKWSYVHTESFFAAMASIFKLNVNSVELLNDAGSEYTAGTKLHFKIRLKAKDYKDVTAMHYASDAIVVAVRGPGFGTRLVRALDAASKKTTDWPHMSRFGWMYGSDIEVLSAIAMPTSGVRAPNGEEGTSVEVVDNTSGLSLEQTNLLLLGVALAAVLILAVVIYLHMRLRHAHALYEKDKGTLSKSGHVLHRMLNTLATSAAEGIATTAGVQVTTSADRARQQRELEMSNRGLMEADEDLED